MRVNSEFAMLNDELLTYLFDSQPHRMKTLMTTWLASSRRFSTFVMTYRSKIRKKLRAAQDLESQLDLRLELETAYQVLNERLLNVVYEPQPSGKLAGPDFAVAYTTSMSFMLEVTRVRSLKEPLRTSGPEERLEAPTPAVSTALLAQARLIDVVCTKLRQLLPQQANVLLIAIDVPDLTAEDLRLAMVQLQHRAERNDAVIMARYGFRDRADLFNHYQRLSELAVHSTPLPVSSPPLTWSNPQARHPLPVQVRTGLYRALSTGTVP